MAIAVGAIGGVIAVLINHRSRRPPAEEKMVFVVLTTYTHSFLCLCV